MLAERMGYSHYFCRAANLDLQRFARIVEQAHEIARALAELGIQLAGRDGSGDAVLELEEITFNGSGECGHETAARFEGTAWPSPNARGFANAQRAAITESDGFTLLPTRMCNGDCSYETFCLPRVLPSEEVKSRLECDPIGDGLIFDSCKTAFRPYDLAVTSILIVAKHHLGDQITVRSDGETAQWADAQDLCERLFGFGRRYGLEARRGLVAIESLVRACETKK